MMQLHDCEVHTNGAQDDTHNAT